MYEFIEVVVVQFVSISSITSERTSVLLELLKAALTCAPHITNLGYGNPAGPAPGSDRRATDLVNIICRALTPLMHTFDICPNKI